MLHFVTCNQRLRLRISRTLSSVTTGTISSAGIGSGLDVNSIVTKLMAVEQQPLTKLQRTGQNLHKEKFTEEVLYGEEQKISPLSSYFELMDRLIPNFLGVISPQKVRGTRVLLR